MSRYGIGIDTSCYTTSVAVIDIETLVVVDNFQKILSVKRGERGLRQSDAFYQHVQNFGEYFDQAESAYFQDAEYVAVSTKPRNVEDSYMPVFSAGYSFAKTISKIAGCPLIETDHQSGHLAAALFASIKPKPERFLGVHLSGGTTELLNCNLVLGNDRTPSFQCEIIGGTLDISAGQLIDRLGVAMDISFPCGKEMEQIASNRPVSKQMKLKFPKVQKKAYFNLSGGENKGMTLVRTDVTKEEISASVLDYIARQLVEAILACTTNDMDAIVLSGGVAANDYIANAIEKAIDIPVIRGEKRFCTDNALGVAYLPLMRK